MIGSHLWSIWGPTNRWRHLSQFLLFYYIKERDSMLLITIGPFNNRSQMTSKCGEKISDIFLVLALFDVIRNLFLNRIKGMVFHHGCHAENVTWHAKERLQRITSVKHATSENQFMFENLLVYPNYHISF